MDRTLASEVVVRRDSGTARVRNVVVIAESRPRGGTRLSFNNPGSYDGVDVILTEAERIALIEALGGTVVR